MAGRVEGDEADNDAEDDAEDEEQASLQRGRRAVKDAQERTGRVSVLCQTPLAGRTCRTLRKLRSSQCPPTRDLLCRGEARVKSAPAAMDDRGRPLTFFTTTYDAVVIWLLNLIVLGVVVANVSLWLKYAETATVERCLQQATH